MNVTVVIITKDRPLQLKRLLSSILHVKIPSFSLVLIDDSTPENFDSVKDFIASFEAPCEHKSSIEARKDVEKMLKRTDLDREQKSLIEPCVGLRSHFTEYAEAISKMRWLGAGLSTILSPSFSPYSTARNLGIYCACRAFDPEAIVFLDDDCYVENPESLMDAFHLLGKKINGKEIIAVSGLYEELSLYTQERRDRHERSSPISILRGMDSFLRRSFLTGQEQRLVSMPYHTLGGALMLAKRVFSSLPFDPNVPRGEDHAYCIDLKNRYGRDFIIVRDNLFIVQHDEHPQTSQNFQDVNTLRDVFRFVYLRFKVGHSFIPLFTIRWTLDALIHLFLEGASKRRWYITELLTLLFFARIFAKRNSGKYQAIAKAWESLISEIET